MAASEKALDRALEVAFRNDPAFGPWFVGRTRFAGHALRLVMARSDYVWGSIPYVLPDPDGGPALTGRQDCETDVLVVFERADASRFALHIENKLAGGAFEPLQPELYAQRAAHWRGKERYGSYDDFATVLVAPAAFQWKNARGAAHFDHFISHEEIAAHIPLFAG